MTMLTESQSGRELTRVWLGALEETARDFFADPKEFCQRAYEHSTENWLNILANGYGLVAGHSTTIREALENYIHLGVRGGLFRDASQFVIKEVHPNWVEIKVLSCPYLDSCRDLLEREVTVKELTCARIGCFRAAVLLLAGLDCSYAVTTFDSEEGCEGYIERK